MKIPPHAGALDKTQKAKGDGQGLTGAWAACFFFGLELIQAIGLLLCGGGGTI